MTIKRIKKKVKHQDIGGKDFIVDENITETLSNEYIINNYMLNYACHNFIHRRPDFDYDFPYKLYYGKINGLGYIVSEDEFESEVK